MDRYDANGVVKELEAMTAVSRALASLTDPASRQRVIRWAIQKFQFEAGQGADPGCLGADQTEEEEAIDALFRELAADFQRLALKSHGA